jgi:tetratricopeptide (TPR) repeat protein
MRPGDFQIEVNLGRAFLEMPGRLDEAIAQFEAALRQRPNSAAVHLDLAVALLQVPGRSGEAVPHLEEALRLQPSLERARRLLDLVRKSSR